MPNTPEQTAYDNDLAALDLLVGAERTRAKEAFDAKYPNGRPVETAITNADVVAGLGTAVNLGIGEAILADPIYGAELKKVFDLYKAGKKTEASEALYKTKFAKLDTDARDRYLAKLENTSLYKERLTTWLIGIKKSLKGQGSTLSDQQLEDYYIKGIDNATILDEALKATKFEPGKTGGNQANSYNALLSAATRNGVSMSLLPKVLGFDTMDEVVKDLQTGADINDYTQKIRNYAKTAMPEWAKKMIDQGTDLTDIVNPYRATISDVLDLPYTSIDVTDKHIQNALASNMSLSDLRKQLRKDDRWQYTDAAHSEVANATKQVLQDFGFMG
jgi:hypothetical protein